MHDTTRAAIAQAQAAGYTHVCTFGGSVPLTDWQPGDLHRLTLEAGYLCGPWRALDVIERLMLQDRGEDPAGRVARDRFPLATVHEFQQVNT